MASAGENIKVCYNYGCKQEATVRFSDRQLRTLAKRLRSLPSAAEERKALADVVGQMYYWAGQQSPVYADKGGNAFDDEANGAMDCIDHSTTTTRFLKMLERRGLLKYHVVADIERRRRFFLFDHFSAVVQEFPRPISASTVDGDAEKAKTHQYVIDSWFVNNGEPAVVLPLEDWLNGAGPRIEPSH
ncbi:hypothetical protein GCM10011430_11430 [Oxalicibacterium solurbis]|uniref:Uncharacterized protein n=1 Tax=Oxalicibacterium solurbis TaxID=69280 RepID=A0A8J3B382_9BURK|nr:hypothetical protein GCM10011430_11430 [Oxalicibacterium solurbis]